MDVLIIGAGAAGLMAARELSKSGLKVCVLEGRNRVGGRIYTLPDSSCGIACEAGAEFIHGKLPVTLKLFKEAQLDYEPASGSFYEVSNGNWKEEEEVVEDTPLLIERLKNLKENISVTEFLQREFPEEKYNNLKQSLQSYIEGYYSGDPKRTSAMSFYNEWQSEDEEQYRPKEGYGKMIQYLMEECQKSGVIIELSTAIKEVRWLKDQVEVLDESHHGYTARKLIIAVPLGVWQAAEGVKGSINFTPGLPKQIMAAKQMGFGNVVKILLQFKEPFWEDKNTVKNSDKGSDFSFVFSDTPIGTWWSQVPKHVPLLTGWIAGPKALEMSLLDDNVLIEKAIESVSKIFEVSIETVKSNLQTWHVFNWTNDPFTRGSYAYSTVETKEARKIMMEPVENTLFIAGDAFYDGPEMGTVEAALTSGKRVAKQVLEAMVNTH